MHGSKGGSSKIVDLLAESGKHDKSLSAKAKVFLGQFQRDKQVEGALLCSASSTRC